VNYLEQLRQREGGYPQNTTPPTDKTDKTQDSGKDELTELTKPGYVGFASAGGGIKGVPLHVPMSRARRETISKAWDGEALREYFEALLMGRLVLCGNCAHFAFAEDPAALGYCFRFKVESWPFTPFKCEGFETATYPAVPLYVPDPEAKRAREYR
jgi:hypothetical protein